MKLKTLKILIAILIFLGLFIGGFIFTMYYMHIGETIQVGAGYGFEIGMSKKNAFQVLLEKSKGGELAFIYCFAKASNTGELAINLENQLDITNMNDWQIRVRSRIIVDEMRLRFDNNGKLIEICRHRDLFEMP